MTNALKINKKDNVVVAVEKIKLGGEASYDDLEGKIVKIKTLDDIPAYHKIATSEIKKGDYIIKYGEHIGIASKDIKKGSHVHLQNVADNRENLRDKD